MNASTCASPACQQRLTAVYAERNALAQLLAALAIRVRWDAGTAADPKLPDLPVIFLDTPVGQLSWHVQAHQVHPWLPPYRGEWDGHTTTAKQVRVEALTKALLAGPRRKVRLPKARRRRPTRMAGLTESQRRHLVELLDAPFWHPETAGQWSCARSLCRLGYLAHLPHRGSQPYELTPAGRQVALRVRTGEPAPLANQHKEAS